jgi:hypothetical protein
MYFLQRFQPTSKTEHEALTEQTLKNELARAFNLPPELVGEGIKELQREEAEKAFAPFAPTTNQTSPEIS